ncbi:MAG: hypothetical protein ACC628_16840 [Pirellulaceae bacterium]
MGSTTSVFAWCLAAVCLNPVEKVAVDRVDLIEINHFFDEQGRLVFDQIIFYDWSPSDSRYNVRDWRLLKMPAQVPLRNWRNNDYIAIWHDFKDRDVLRKVHASMLRETWTQYDPELVEREFLPQERRRALHKRVAGRSLEDLDAHVQRHARRTSVRNAAIRR